jgi:hypothetical protein
LTTPNSSNTVTTHLELAFVWFWLSSVVIIWPWLLGLLRHDG